MYQLGWVSHFERQVFQRNTQRKMQIRSATPGDSLKIAKVHLTTWKFAYAGIVAQEYLDSLSIEPRKHRWDEILQRTGVKELTLVAEVDLKEVAYGWDSI
jgi:hypothetical protein